MLTTAQIRGLKTRKKRYSVTDGRGLNLEVYATGTKVWRFRYRAGDSGQEVTIGRWPRVSVNMARQLAGKLRQRIANGENPALMRRLGRDKALDVTVREFAARWLVDRVEKVRKDAEPVRRMLKRDIYPMLGNRPIADVGPIEVQAIVFARRDRGRPAAAAAMRNLCKRLWDYARVCGLTEKNPADATPVKFIVTAKSRTRVLSRGEVGKFLHTVKDTRIGAWQSTALRLLLLTMTRKSELRLARWEHIDLERAEWEIPPEISKTGLAHIVYLSRQAIELFRELASDLRYQPFITLHREMDIEEARRMFGSFPAQPAGAVSQKVIVTPPMEVSVDPFPKPHGLIFKGHNATETPTAPGALNVALKRVNWGMPKFTVHDLRRTAATTLAELGYEERVIERALNHAKKGIVGVYNRAEYADQRRTMLQDWADWLEKLEGQ